MCGSDNAKPMYVAKTFTGERIQIGETCSRGCDVILWITGLPTLDEYEYERTDNADMIRERTAFMNGEPLDGE